MVKYRFNVESTNFDDSEYEEEVDLPTEGMDEDEEYEYVEGEFDEWLWNNINGGWSRVEENDERH